MPMSREDLRHELERIERHIERTRDELSALQPARLRREPLQKAGAELGAIVSETENAANRMIDAAERLTAQDFDNVADYKAFNAAQALAILEACTFQDLTGQRVGKVVGVLEQISVRISRLADALGVVDAVAHEDDPEAEPFLEGPALPGKGLTQGDIDDELDETTDQSTLDNMFD